MNRRQFLTSMVGMAAASAGGFSALATAPVAYDVAGARMTEGFPVDEGFRFPAEWEPHELTLMQFPPPQNWYRHQLEGARRDWADVANTVVDFEPVIMAVRPEDRAIAEKLLSSAIDLIEMDLNDAWSRDAGPMIVVNDHGERRVAGFTFNGWGRKLPPYDADAMVKGRFAAHLDLAMYVSDLVMEGGAVALDGEGTLITTEECLLNPNRNRDWSKAGIEQELKRFLGVETVIWIPRGLTPDPITDGHIDGMAAFSEPGVVLLHTIDDPSDPNHEITQKAKQILQETEDARGRRFEIVEIPLTSDDLAHMNFYICNGGVVVPATGRAAEDDAPLGILREMFPGREVVGVPGEMMAEGGGGVHCITQQVPAV